MTGPETDGWSLVAPLDADATPESSDPSVDIEAFHDHEFATVAGSPAWVPRDRDATLEVIHEEWPDGAWSGSGTVSTWISPLEDVGSRDPKPNPDWDGDSRFRLPVVSDVYPWHRHDDSVLALIVYAEFHPGLMAKCVPGYKGYLADASTREEELLRAQTHLDHFDLRQGHWYHLAVAWDESDQRLDLYVDGELAIEMPDLAERRVFGQPGDALYVGNPFVAVADLRVSDRYLEPTAVRNVFEEERVRYDRQPDPHVETVLHGSQLPTAAFDTEEYTLQTKMSLTEPEEVDRWTPHGPDTSPLGALRATPEGMLFETRDAWEGNLCTLWGPESYEGDILLTYDFRNERDVGLALVVFNATTFSRQDVLEDRNYPVTGSMRTIVSKVRNYWWEYMRRTPPVRHDRSTQVLAKGPHNVPALGAAVTDVPAVDTWHTLTVNKEGDRIRCAIDDTLVFDVTDSAFSGTGGSYNAGRIGLRHMQKTRVRYRDLEVYTKDPPVEK